MGSRRGIRVGATALILGIGLLAPPAAAPVHAAAGGLALSSNAAYVLDPDAGVVHVTIDLTATNEKPNTTSGNIVTRYFYEGATIAIHEEATRVRATSGGVRLGVSVDPEDGYSILEVRFRSDLFFRQTVRLTVTYDLPGGAPRSESDIRVGTAFASFYAWAFGDEGDVRITLPGDFAETVTGATVERTAANGVTTLAATDIADPIEWYVVVIAEREASLTRERLELAGDNALVIRAWPEDDEWRTRVADLLRDGLPELVDLIGLAWPVEADLEIFEVHTPLLEGYAGFFIADENKIEISEDLDDLTILHEASHAWFNTDLFVERWIYEGFADDYAARALESVVAGDWVPDDVSAGDTAAVRLNEWRHPGRITDQATEDREQFGYHASWTVVRALVDEIGLDAMRAVIAAADERLIAYPGAGEREAVAGAVDWRRFLDLLEGDGGSDEAEAIFREWIVTGAQERLLEERARARTAYDELVADGDGWLPPFLIRDFLSRWSFAGATDRIPSARSILEARDEIETTAADVGVTVPGSLRARYEGAVHSLDDARAIADAQLAAIRALDGATDAVAAERDLFVTVGLIGTEPEIELAAAGDRFEADDAAAAEAAAGDVRALLDGAAEVGRTRVIAVAGGTLLVLLVGVGLIVLVRRRRGPTHPPALAAATASTPVAETVAGAGPPSDASGAAVPEPSPSVEQAQPYATLADPDQPTPGGGEDRRSTP